MDQNKQRKAIAEVTGTEGDYPRDLNAMHEVEKLLTESQCYRYRDELVELCAETDGPSSWPFHATAAQRAEAFLRTIGKWEED